VDGLGGLVHGFFFYFCFSCLIYGGGQNNRLCSSPINRDLYMDAVGLPAFENLFRPSCKRFLY
jgi:hypothetical protein